jgi:hypothetical protein
VCRVVGSPGAVAVMMVLPVGGVPAQPSCYLRCSVVLTRTRSWHHLLLLLALVL